MHKKATFNVLLVIAALGFAGNGLCQAVADEPEEEALRPAVAKLRDIERKAAEHDIAVRRAEDATAENQQLKATVATMQNQLKQYGRLEDMQRKALAYGYLKDKVTEQEQKIAELERQLAQEKYLTALQAEDVSKLNKDIAGMRGQESEFKDQVAGLQETIDQLRMGRMEFYEVKEGDTLESIAGNPLIYDDATKAEQIRQANVRRIEDFDDLKPGEVLVIPHFPESGKYRF
ncbi:MAG: LysM peptidoglycan-binding domain-containing protein [Lentisphaerae bacterium]|nr:LysM peptidoglycan-binding domain-containing protein [Lentisphaerota bacterium]